MFLFTEPRLVRFSKMSNLFSKITSSPVLKLHKLLNALNATRVLFGTLHPLLIQLFNFSNTAPLFVLQMAALFFPNFDANRTTSNTGNKISATDLHVY